MTAPLRPGEPSLFAAVVKAPAFAPGAFSKGPLIDETPFLQSFLQGFPPLPVKAGCCVDRRNALEHKSKLVYNK